jgi:hypothetical protein
LADLLHFIYLLFIQKEFKKYVIYFGNYKYFKKHVAKKYPSKNPFYEKLKMSTKGLFG